MLRPIYRRHESFLSKVSASRRDYRWHLWVESPDNGLKELEGLGNFRENS